MERGDLRRCRIGRDIGISMLGISLRRITNFSFVKPFPAYSLPRSLMYMQVTYAKEPQ